MNIASIELIDFQIHKELTVDFTNGINVLIGASGKGKCLTGDTIIPCPITGAYRSINDMLNEPEWWVWSIDCKNKLVKAKVNNIQLNGVKDVYRLLLTNGDSIKATSNHRFLTNYGWKTLNNIHKDDFIASVKKIPEHKTVKSLSIEECRTLGYMISDGGTTKAPVFTNQDYCVLRDLLSCVHSSFGNHHVRKNKHGNAITLVFSKPVKTRDGKSNKMCHLQRFLKNNEVMGKKSTEKQIPKEVFKLSIEQISNVIASMYLCDGHINKKSNKLEYTSASKLMIFQLKHLLLRFNIISSVYKKKKFYTLKNGQRSKIFISYDLVISDNNSIVSFYKNIKLIGRKKVDIECVIQNRQNFIKKSYGLPFPLNFALTLKKECKKSKYTARDINNKINACDRTGYFTTNKNTSINLNTATKIVSVLENSVIDKQINGDVCWRKIKSIKYTGKEPTYDLEVAKHHNFIANNMVTHNSCIRRAIEWCLFNKSIDGIRKEGSKKTSVKITLANGTIVERIRSASINRYVLVVDEKEQTFDSIGKSLPQEVKDAVGINPMVVDGEELWLNSSQQIALPFLFDKSPAWRMKLFNKLTGNDLLDKLFVSFNKDILRIGREHKSDTERLEKLSVELETKDIEKEQLEAIHSVVKNQIDSLRDKQINYDKHLALLDLQQTNETQTNNVKEQKTCVTFPEDTEIKGLATKIEDLCSKQEVMRAVLSNDNELGRVSVELSKNVVQAVDFVKLQAKLDRLDMLETVIKRQNDTNLKDKEISTKIADLTLGLSEDKDKLDKLLESTEDCPLCNQKLSLECKHQLKQK